MDRRKDTAVEALLEQLIEHRPDDIAGMFARAFELAMQLERKRFLNATIRKRGGRKLIIAPNGTTATPQPRPRVDSALLKALARGFRWQKMLKEGLISHPTLGMSAAQSYGVMIFGAGSIFVLWYALHCGRPALPVKAACSGDI